MYLFGKVIFFSSHHSLDQHILATVYQLLRVSAWCTWPRRLTQLQQMCVTLTKYRKVGYPSCQMTLHFCVFEALQEYPTSLPLILTHTQSTSSAYIANLHIEIRFEEPRQKCYKHQIKTTCEHQVKIRNIFSIRSKERAPLPLSCCICTCTDSVHAGPDGSELSGSDDDPMAFTRRRTEWGGRVRKEECRRTSAAEKRNRGTDSQEQKT